MPERDYSHRSAVDKLGIKPGFAVAFVAAPQPIASDLRTGVLERAGRAPAQPGEPPDVVLVGADASTDVVQLLSHWRAKIDQAGGIWLLTPKRGQPGYINHTDLIPLGAAAGLVDNKICSVSDTLSGMRFVIRKVDRVYS